MSTGNIVSSYLGQSGFSYKSYSEEKDLLKQKTIETMMLYGISLLAAVSVLIVKNRCEKYESRLRIIKRTGAKDTVLVRICMLECVREAIWCPFVAVIVILLDWLTLMLYVRRIR